MRASEFAELRAFAAIIRQGTFTRAAAHLGITVSTLSQTIRNLEERLDRRLLNRTTRSVAPTEAGALLAARLFPLLDDLDAATSSLTADNTPSGRLRINAYRFAGAHILAPLVAPFLQHYPAISLEIVINDELVDIVAAGFDAGVRLGEQLENDMVAVRLGGDVRMAVVGAPSYLAAHGAPQHPRELSGHRCINMRWPTDRSLYRWEFENDGEEIKMPVNGPFTCDDATIRLRAAADGAGLIYVFEHEAAELIAAGHVVRVLEDWTPPFAGCFLYYPGRRHVGGSLRAFIDFAKAELIQR